jgi:hypothetical protein
MPEALFQEPAIATAPQPRSTGRADLVEVSHALESMRDAGFDLTAAAGEPIDNSIQAAASIIHVRTIRTRDNKAVEAIAFADNGAGISPEGLAHVLKMGYSTRYGERKGLGRFGVGLKLATLSVARRLEVITRPVGSDKYYSAYVDLDEVAAGDQQYIEAVEVDGWPEDLRDLMAELPTTQGKAKASAAPASGQPFTSGTLVVWRKVDRIKSGGPYATALDERDADLRKFIARAYRKFLDQGLQITLNGAVITLHDPLFLMDNPRIAERYKAKKTIPRGRIVDEGDLSVEGHAVHIVLALVPEEFRPWERAGGNTDADGKDIRDLQINQDNEGRISILRNGREIYYDLIPRFLPEGVNRGDRYFAVEISFPAELDEFFQVRHVKRGAEPVSKLRKELRTWLQRPVKTARKQVRDHWGEVKNAERQASRPHTEAMEASKAVERSAPVGKAGAGVTPAEAEAAVVQIIEDVLGDAAEAEPERVEEIRRTIDEGRLSLLDANWAGTDLFEITHLNGKAVVVLNHRHPFVRTFYEPISDIADGRQPIPEPGGIVDLARRTETAFDFLLLAYAKAENYHADPERFTELKTHWAMYLKNLVHEWQSGKE